MTILYGDGRLEILPGNSITGPCLELVIREIIVELYGKGQN